jgi:hypothetical protein
VLRRLGKIIARCPSKRASLFSAAPRGCDFAATYAGSIRQFTAWNDKIDIPTGLRFFCEISAA